jgi:hypothetical protein
MRALRLAGRKTSAKYAVPMPVMGNAISPANCQKLIRRDPPRLTEPSLEIVRTMRLE